MENGRLTDLMESVSQEMKISVVTITFHVKTADIMTVRSLTSVSGYAKKSTATVDIMESASQKIKISVVTITFHVKTVDFMTVRSLTSVSGVVGVEMENGRLTDHMESASQE